MAEHWYDAITGKPTFEVPYASGEGSRATTKADARKLNLNPSVTAMAGLLDKPGLNRWRIDKVLDEAWGTNIFSTAVNPGQWKKEVIQRAEKEMGKSSKTGTEIHKSLERFYTEGAITSKFKKIIEAVEICINEKIGHIGWESERFFSHPYGFGGTVDLSWKKPGDNHLGIILDFKTKDTDDVKKMVGYRDHVMQLAAYRNGLGMQSAECYNLFISTQKPGIVVLQKYTEDELEKGWEMFKCLLKFWQLDNKFKVFSE